MKRIIMVLVALVAFAWAGVNVNTADVKELSSLKGIGVKKAKAIITYRTEHGAFHSVDELTQVKGIGPKVLAKIKPELVVK